MKIQTFSIVVGTRACDAHCPFCVSRLTGFATLPKTRKINRINPVKCRQAAILPKAKLFNRVNFDKACRLAQLGGTTTVLMTGKGEPTLYPAEVTTYLDLLKKWAFPLIELQTNELALGRLARGGSSGIKGLDKTTLTEWQKKGLNTIAISAVDVRNESNAAIYNPDYPDLSNTIKFIHSFGFTARLCIMMMKGLVDNPLRVQEVIDFCRVNKVEQLTIRPIRKPRVTVHDEAAARFVTEHGLDNFEIKTITDGCLKTGVKLLTLPLGAIVLDMNGQNLCLSDCLNETGEDDDIRTLIFYPDGALRYRWDYDGAIILGGSEA